MQTVLLSWMLMLGALTGAGNFPIDMFETTSHQFGTVMRGATTEYEFVFTNRYKEDVIVESVQSSCQCTTPTLLTPGRIRSGEQGKIKIHINTQNFVGNKNATITVRFASPVRTEMQLHSYVYIRSDVSVNPGIVYFGTVDLEKNPSVAVVVNVNSVNANWQIVDIQSGCPFLGVEKKKIQSYQGSSYNLTVRLRPNAQKGPFSEIIELVTNDYDQRTQRIPIRVEGRIKQTLSANPSPLGFNVITEGEKVTKTLVIQGAEDFRIIDIKSEDHNISASIDGVSKKVQPIQLTYSGTQLGEFNGKITVYTDLEGGMTTAVIFNGKVVPAPKPQPEPEVETEAEKETETQPLPEPETVKENETNPLPEPETDEKEEVKAPEEEKKDEAEALDLLSLPNKEKEPDAQKEDVLPDSNKDADLLSDSLDILDEGGGNLNEEPKAEPEKKAEPDVIPEPEKKEEAEVNSEPEKKAEAEAVPEPEILPGDIEEVKPSEKHESATQTKPKVKGRNLLLKK